MSAAAHCLGFLLCGMLFAATNYGRRFLVRFGVGCTSTLAMISRRQIYIPAQKWFAVILFSRTTHRFRATWLLNAIQLFVRAMQNAVFSGSDGLRIC